MGRPWGLSGPDFLYLYAGALMAICAAFVLVRSWARASADGAHRGAKLDLYEFACLSGGPDRVTDTAVAGLVESGALRTSRKRQLTATGRSGTDELQVQVLDLITSASTVQRVRKALRHAESVRALAPDLQERGLLVAAGPQKVLSGIVALCPLLGVVGVVRLVNGVAQGYPVGFLGMALMVTLFLWMALRAKSCVPNRTAAGDRAIAKGSRRSLNAQRVREAELAASAATVLVATHGLSAYPDRGVAMLLAPPSGGSGGVGAVGGPSCGGGGGGGCGGGGC